MARLYEHLSDNAIVIAASSGQLHRFCAVAAGAGRRSRGVAEERCEPAIRAYLARHVTIGVAFPPLETAKGSLDPFFNINTPDELALARSYLENLQS